MLEFRPDGPTKSELKIETDLLSLKKNNPHSEALQWRYRKFREKLYLEILII